jgi:sugar/nucleoside kinase (ribokinase family)
VTRERGTFGVLSHLVLDVLVDGREAPGGAGLYAALGLRMATRGRVAPSAGVGRDFHAATAELFASWRLSAEALAVRSDSTPRTLITYHPDGGRSERSVLGDAHFAAHRPEVADLDPARSSLLGLYTFQDAEPGAWADIVALRRDTGCCLLWELSAVERGPRGWERVAGLLGEVDVVSLNVAEGEALVGHDRPEAIAGALVARGARVAVVRAGGDGSAVGDATTLLTVGAAAPRAVVDPTGAGNTYSGAFLGAWVETRSLESAARLAAAAASFAIEQVGPPPAPPAAELVAARARATEVTSASWPLAQGRIGA